MQERRPFFSPGFFRAGARWVNLERATHVERGPGAGACTVHFDGSRLTLEGADAGALLDFLEQAFPTGDFARKPPGPTKA